MSRKYRVKLRLKRKKEIYKRTAISLFIIIILAFSPYLYSYVRGYIYKLCKNNEFKNINTINVDFKERYISVPLMELLKNKIGLPFQEEIKKEIINYINFKWPYVSNIKVEYKSFRGELFVGGKVEKGIALCYCGSEKKYLLESGRIIDNINFGENFIKLRLTPCRKILSQEFLSFITDFYRMKSKMSFEIKEILYNEKNEVEVIMADNGRIIWGGWDFVEEKILILNDILNDALNKLSPPLRVDLRFFEEGKAFVSTEI